MDSVKTDAVTIDATNLELAKSLLKFNNSMGSLRLSNTDAISYPKHKFITKKWILKLKLQYMKLIS